MKNLKLLLFFLLIIPSVIAQSKYSFKNIKHSGDRDYVYFKVNNVLSDEDAENLKKVFTSDNNINETYVNSNGSCKLVVSGNIDADYIKNLLHSVGLDYDYSTIDINQRFEAEKLENSKKYSQKNRTDGMPEHYPVFLDTGNPDLDKKNYEIDKINWISNYPLEVITLRGISVEDYYSELISNGKEPKFIDTGDPIIDKERFDIAIKKWTDIHNKK